MEFDFLSFVLGIVVGLFIAYSIVRIAGRLLYNKLVSEGVIKSVEEEENKTESNRIEMKVEKHGDVLYAFRKDTDDFICQGADFAELKNNFAKRFPGHNGSLEGTATELHEELARQKRELSKTA